MSQLIVGRSHSSSHIGRRWENITLQAPGPAPPALLSASGPADPAPKGTSDPTTEGLAGATAQGTAESAGPAADLAKALDQDLVFYFFPLAITA